MKSYRHLFWLALGAAIVLIASAATQANPKLVRVTWDPPTTEEVPHVEGYNVYRVTIAPSIKLAESLRIPHARMNDYFS